MNFRKALIPLVAAGAVAAPIVGLGLYYRSRRETTASLKKITDYDSPYNLYVMDIKYNYNIDRIIKNTLPTSDACVEAIRKEAAPFVPLHIKAPDFGCSAFTYQGTQGKMLMGRNYDFKNDSSALLVRSNPKHGYKSLAFCALDNLYVTKPEKQLMFKFAGLMAPFMCLDGVNEKGVSIAVLTLDSKPTRQFSSKPLLSTAMVVRLVLDRAASTQEAVDLLSNYDMFAICGRDYHFYITDSTGDGRVVEFDCESPERKMTVTPTRSVTNFYIMHGYKVVANQHNGVYGHGRERYEAIEKILSKHADDEVPSKEVAWEALRAASQAPREDEITSNTQWSIVYDNANFSGEICIRRNWKDVYSF